MLRELAPLLAGEGIDVDNIDIPDLDTLPAPNRAVERRNMGLFSPAGQIRDIALIGGNGVGAAALTATAAVAEPICDVGGSVLASEAPLVLGVLSITSMPLSAPVTRTPPPDAKPLEQRASVLRSTPAPGAVKVVIPELTPWCW